MVAEILVNEYGLEPIEVKPLVGYANKNYLIVTKSGRYIFKTYLNESETLELLEAENETLTFLETTDFGEFPRPVPFTDGTMLKVLPLDDGPRICRMLSFVPGEFLGDVEQTEQTVASLGTFLAKLDKTLLPYSNTVLRARQSNWDLQYFTLNKKFMDDIEPVSNRNLVRYFFMQYDIHVLPLLSGLRKSVIHADANEWNVMVMRGKVSGLIDFGDLAHSHLINELAIACAYVCYDKEDPLPLAKTLVKAYHDVLPLEEREITVLYYLIAARLCTSVCNSAHAKKADPTNVYAQSSEELAWQMLHKWLRIHPLKLENMLRETLGMTTKSEASEEEIKSIRHQHISPILSISYHRPIHMKGAAFQYMYDAHGNTFLDAYNNIPHVGHSHPKVVEAGQRQMAVLNTNTRYLYEHLNSYAERLLNKFPAPLNRVFFVNSGSAASDLAIRMAYAHTQKNRLLVMEHGYHGNSQIGIDISDYKFSNPKGQGQRDYILKTQLPDTYRGKHTQNDGSAGEVYASEAMESFSKHRGAIAAFITEPIVGCGGQVPLAKGYLKPMYEAIRSQGGVCISDEVQTGFGRLGAVFWGFEQQEVVPDMVVLGKPMGNGHPMAAVVTTSEIAASFAKGVEFFSSFGGNPVSCAIGMAVLDVIEEEALQENAKIVGDYYKKLVRELQADHASIGDVRGSGLFLGIDIVKHGSKVPNTQLAQVLKNELRNRHILVSTDGPADNVIKSKPPLCFTKNNVEEVVETMSLILKSQDCQ